MKSTTIFSPGAMRPLASHCHLHPDGSIQHQDDIVIIDVIGF